jgi:hypothetical protein
MSAFGGKTANTASMSAQNPKQTTHIADQLSTNARLSKFSPIQVAVASGNAVGKTALLSWLILWSVMTFEDCLGVVTAGTEPQIRTRLWGELSKWFH